jgi:dTDP-4-amino-4,6-dideoxygalactose transaminase
MTTRCAPLPLIRGHGQEVRYRHDYFGLNWRMQDINAAIGLAQLGKLEAWNAARIRNAEVLSNAITAAQTPWCAKATATSSTSTRSA